MGKRFAIGGLVCVGLLAVVVCHFLWRDSFLATPRGAYAPVDFRTGEVATVPLSVRPAAVPVLPLTAADRDWLVGQMHPSPRQPVNVGYCLHWLRFHGSKALFPGQGNPFRSAGEVLDILTDAAAGARYFGQPVLIRTRDGARFPTGDVAALARGAALELHRDQCLAALAELGVPLDRPLSVPGGEALTLADVLRDSVAHFHLGQKELEWTAIGYVLYLPPRREWTNRFGERFTWDDLTDTLRRRPFDQASCAGTHLLYALTILARVDAEQDLLGPGVRTALQERLRDAVATAVATQREDGSWPYDWHRGLTPDGQRTPGWSRDAVTDEARLLATGHLVEWMLYLPDQLQPPRRVYQRAAPWLFRQLKQIRPEERQRLFCPCTHAAGALRCLTSTFSGDRSD